MTDEIAGIGHNNPPCPFADHIANVGKLMELAAGTLTGDVKTQLQYDQVDALSIDVKAKAKALDDTRKAEKAPWDAGAKAVQDIAMPLAKKLDAILDSIKHGKSKFLAVQKAERSALEQRKRDEAANLLAEAQALRADASRADLEASLAADELLEKARIAAAPANRVAKAPKRTRTVWSSRITDPLLVGKWLWQNRNDAYFAMLYELAKKEARGIVPGVEWTSREDAT